MNFKKLFVALSAVACGLSLASCGKKQEPTENPVSEKKSTHIGLGYDADFAFESGSWTASVTGALVSFDAEGKIMSCRLDVVQVKLVAGTAEADVIDYKTALADGQTYVATKLELGKNYNMVTYGGAIAEVDAQIEAYAKWAVGKTSEYCSSAMKVKEGAESTEAVYAKDADLESKCTISVDSFARAIADAYARKVEGVVSESAKAGISLISTKSEKNHGAGYDQVSVDMSGALVKDGKQSKNLEAT